MKYNKIFPSEYPTLLKQLRKQPDHLYIAGAPIPSDVHRFLCVVGARKYDDYGKQVCDELINGLKDYPVVIVSGLAIGIDSLAHEAALENGLRTIAVPGSGLDDASIYPRTHYDLARHIIDSGNTLISPFEPDQLGNIWTFPVRNQLMAALGDATLVIEGRKKSGTLLTAKYTLELDREVMIVPGSIFSELSYGPHTLYRDGAKPVTCSEEILEILGFEIDHEDRELTNFQLELVSKDLPVEQRNVLKQLQFKPSSSTEIIEKFGFSAVQFTVIATKLELKGLIAESNGIFRLC